MNRYTITCDPEHLEEAARAVKVCLAHNCSVVSFDHGPNFVVQKTRSGNVSVRQALTHTPDHLQRRPDTMSRV